MTGGYLVLLCLACVVQAAVGVNFVVLAPRELRYGVDETVVVVVSGGGSPAVNLKLQDYPHRRRTLTTQQGQWREGVGEFTVKVEPSIFNNSVEDLKMEEWHSVYLVASVGGQVQESVIPVSGRANNVFIQTDKPLYTPDNTAHITVYATDVGNKPTDMPIRLDIVSPAGLIVDRKDANTCHIVSLNECVTGMLRHKLTINKRPLTGNWTIVANYGPRTDFGEEYSENVTATIEVKEYVLPTFDCEIQDVPNYILEGMEFLDGIKIKAKSTHGQAVVGEVSYHVGITRGQQIVRLLHYYRRKIKDDGSVDVEVDLQALHDALQPFPDLNTFDKRVDAGARLTISADCRESASGELMQDVNTAAFFAKSPVRFNYDHTLRYFKPALLFTYQFQLEYHNGQKAAGERIEIKAVAHLTNGNKKNLNAHRGDNRDSNDLTVLTDDLGIARIALNTESDMERIDIEFELITREGNVAVTEKDVIYKYTNLAQRDIALTVEGEKFKVGANIPLGIFFKGGTFTELVYMVLARGRVVKVHRITGKWENFYIENIGVTKEMVPEVRIVVIWTEGDKVGGDSLWVDIDDSCGSKDFAVGTDQATYTINGRETDFTMEVTGATPSTYVTLQMVDRAVLVLNDRQALTPQRMFAWLEEGDLGSGGGGGSNLKNMLDCAGLIVASNMVSGSLNTGSPSLKPACHASGGRRRRSINQDIEIDNSLTKEDCCERGQNITQENPGLECNDHVINFFISSRPTTECLNTFKRCCENFNGEQTVENEAYYGERSAASDEPVKKLDLDNLGQVMVRHNFPESVAEIQIKTDGRGRYSHPLPLPHSITTWSLQGVELSLDNGLCVAQPHDFVVTKNMFFKVRLPYSAIRGEHLLLKTVFYNTGSNEAKVKIFLWVDEAICSSSAPEKWGSKKVRSVKKGGAVQITWPIVPLKTGKLIVKILATNMDETEIQDYVERTINVRPEGSPSGNSKSFLLDLSTNDASVPRECQRFNAGTLKCTTQLSHPGNYIPNSGKALVAVTANVFGPALDLVITGLGPKVQDPKHCGEQTIIYMAPGVFAYGYMQKTGQTIDENLEKKFSHSIAEGIKKIQQYQRPSGGVAVWADRTASTWLSSIYLKVFSRARALNAFVDEQILVRITNYLNSQQDAEGRMKEPYKVHHKEMIGAVNSRDLTLTAFALIARLEHAHNEKREPDAMTKKSVEFLAKKVKESKSAYEAALVAYALALSESPMRTVAYKILQSKAVDEISGATRLRYFPSDNQKLDSRGNKMRSKLQVEASAYAILAALTMGDLDYCYEIAAWLHTQRRHSGIFTTTSDTIIAIQALAAYAAEFEATRTDLTITVTDSKNNINVDEIKIGDDDKNREFIIQLPAEMVSQSRAVVIEAKGSGVAQVMVELTYNVDKPQTCADFYFPEPKVHVTDLGGDEGDGDRMGGGPLDQLPKANDGKPKKKIDINIQVKFEGEVGTEMAIIEVGILTGYTPDMDKLDALKNDIQLGLSEIETNDASLILYLDMIPADRTLNFNVTMVQHEQFPSIAPAPIKVYDYYNRERECVQFYSEVAQWELSVDKVGTDYVCKEADCAKCYGNQPQEGDHTPYTYEQIKDIVCSPAINYALKLSYVSFETDNFHTYYWMEVAAVMRQGNLLLEREMKVRLAVLHTCSCPRIEKVPGKNYFLMGKSEERYHVNEDEDEYLFQLKIDNDAYMEEWNRKPIRDIKKYLKNKGCST